MEIDFLESETSFESVWFVRVWQQLHLKAIFHFIRDIFRFLMTKANIPFCENGENLENSVDSAIFDHKSQEFREKWKTHGKFKRFVYYLYV